LRLACDNIHLIVVVTVFEIVEFTSIDVNGEFWCPCLENGRFASYNIGNLACCEAGFEVLSSNEGGTVRKRSSDEENVKLHYDYIKGPALEIYGRRTCY
jgi:hypothetical protein